MLSRESFILPKRFEVETYWSFVPHWTTKINKQTPGFCRMSSILSSVRIETPLETTCGFWAQACPSAEQTIRKHQQAGYALGYRHYSNLLLPSKSSVVSVNGGTDSRCWRRELRCWGPLGKVDCRALSCRRSVCWLSSAVCLSAGTWSWKRVQAVCSQPLWGEGFRLTSFIHAILFLKSWK